MKNNIVFKVMLAAGMFISLITFKISNAEIISAADDKNMAQVNPMVEYDSYAELEKNACFDYLYIPAASGFNAEHIFFIDKTIIELDYARSDSDMKMSIRTAKGEDDISGHYSINYTKSDVMGVKVNKGSNHAKTDFTAWWTKNGFSYALSLQDGDEETFNNMVEYAVTLQPAQMTNYK